MKKDIPHNKLTSYLANSPLCIPIYIGQQKHSYIYVPTGKTITIPVRDSYSTDFIKKVVAASNAIDIPFHLFWLYIQVL